MSTIRSNNFIFYIFCAIVCRLGMGNFFGSWISTVCGADGTKEVWNVPFVTGLSDCWIGRVYSEYLLLVSTLLQSVLEVTYGCGGIKFFIFKFSTFSLIFEMYFWFDLFIVDECVGKFVVIGILVVICYCNLLLNDSDIVWWLLVILYFNIFFTRRYSQKCWCRVLFISGRMLRMYRIEFLFIYVFWHVSLVCIVYIIITNGIGTKRIGMYKCIIIFGVFVLSV